MMTMIVGGIETPDSAEEAAALLMQKSLDTRAEDYFACRGQMDRRGTPASPTSPRNGRITLTRYSRHMSALSARSSPHGRPSRAAHATSILTARRPSRPGAFFVPTRRVKRAPDRSIPRPTVADGTLRSTGRPCAAHRASPQTRSTRDEYKAAVRRSRRLHE